jgi:Tfp pilus assembly protein PilV
MNMHTINRQKGFTLTEALVAFVIVAGGMLAIASFQAGLFSSSAYNKARTEALSLAQQKIEEFKHYTHADEDSFIDSDGDGVMDADGYYTDAPIEGQNALFNRSWNLTATDQASQVNVTVGWLDASNAGQSVTLMSSVPWISPRAGGDQIVDLQEPIVYAPTGRARVGEGNLSDYPNVEITQISSPGWDGLSVYAHDTNLFLVDGYNNILLTLENACSTDTGICTDFVKISGTVYLDTANTGLQELIDIFVIASDAAHCARFVTSGTLSSPPTTATGDYEYYNYTCYLGGGWYGNIGFVTAQGVALQDKVCQGDPTAFDPWDEPVIALRRAYRGMLHKTVSGTTSYYSYGIADATELTGQDYVFTQLEITATAGSYCEEVDAPMTRTDSSSGTLFAGTPVDFVCLNSDDDGDSLPDYLDDYDTSEFGADTTCPYDPTDPPVQNHLIAGNIQVLTAETLDLSSFDVVTSDGPGNCVWPTPFTAVNGATGFTGYTAKYACSVYDWGDGWTGYVQLQPNSKYIYCPTKFADFTNLTADQAQHFSCISSNTVTIEGSISFNLKAANIYSMVIEDTATGFQGICRFDRTDYRCLLPYDGDSVNLTLTVSSSDYVCGAVEGVLKYLGYTVDGSPYAHDIIVERNAVKCP